jgi:hypothetical protein
LCFAQRREVANGETVRDFNPKAELPFRKDTASAKQRGPGSAAASAIAQRVAFIDQPTLSA